MPGTEEDRDMIALLSAFMAHPDVPGLKERARDVLVEDHLPMRGWQRTFVGVYLLTLGLAAAVAMPWAWSLASTVTEASPRTVRAHFLGLAFTPTTPVSLMLVVMMAAVLGSVGVMALVFSLRAGHHTLEHGYLWWYLLRPFTAIAVAVLLYMTLMAGFFNTQTINDRPALIVAAAVGGLAGLFTDQALQKMRGVLGLLPFNTGAAGKSEDSR